MAFRIHEWLLTTWGLSIPIPAFFPLLALGFIAGVYVSVREARRAGIDAHQVLDLFLYAALGIIVGARLFVVLPRLDYYLAHPKEIFQITEAGLASHGGFLAGMALITIYAACRGLPFLAVADALPAGFGLFLFLARVGCFLEGSSYGVVTELPWGVRFPSGSVAYAGLLHERLVRGGEPLTPPLHPTQLYSAAAGLCLFALALWLAPRKRFQGEVAFLGLSFYAATRMGIDTLRGDLGDETLFFGLLPTTQLITAALGLAALLGLGYLSWRFKSAKRVGHLV
ncbi:MAG: prolipoprotein diacylglyceryl transferase [Candidatus Rokubacteria bacterium]|nr:prolipoprotein diacylglyceryl transferase [Candidatus Rokubacteria bacterium]